MPSNHPPIRRLALFALGIAVIVGTAGFVAKGELLPTALAMAAPAAEAKPKIAVPKMSATYIGKGKQSSLLEKLKAKIKEEAAVKEKQGGEHQHAKQPPKPETASAGPEVDLWANARRHAHKFGAWLWSQITVQDNISPFMPSSRERLLRVLKVSIPLALISSLVSLGAFFIGQGLRKAVQKRPPAGESRATASAKHKTS